MALIENESFRFRYNLEFDKNRDEWILLVPSADVKASPNGSYEVRLPVYASRAMAIGGNILRKLRKEYRVWLLGEQNGQCAICGHGAELGNPWNLDHQPPLSHIGSRFIDYERKTQNRVIHRSCDSAQTPKQASDKKA